ncbi:MAG: Hsp70 family protein [Candidatus Gastranaerophilales bacterium]|nr:Hsp70 family protein [Candidatus Gastranaerophilales bacterium]
MAIIGIDLGTTNSLVSVWKDGKIQLIPNSFGEYMTPSVVCIEEDGEVFVGKIAKEMLISRPDCTFREFKRNMGTDIAYKAGKNRYRAEELSAFVLRRLKEDAEKYLGEPVTEAIISVPAYFNDDKRCATRNAGRLAGLRVERMINEPSAVALKHHMGTDEMEKFIIFDFGGGTLDVSLVDAFENIVEIQAVAGDNYLGGKDFNEIIADYFYRENNLSRQMFTKEEQAIVLKEAELVKIALSEANSAKRNFLLQEKEYTLEMTNQNLIHISAELFKRMAKPLRKVMSDSGAQWEDIDKVILVGGSSKMPIVLQYIKSICQTEVVADDRPDESIAIGAGMAAAIKMRTGEVQDIILSDICPFSLGVQVVGDHFSPIINRNETLPCSHTGIYVAVQDYQKEISFAIYQGESMVASENLLLETIEIEIPPKPAGEVKVAVTFAYDINGILDVRLSREDQSYHKVIVNKNMRLSEQELEVRLKELQEMTIHPKEQEQNRLLVEEAHRLYKECHPEFRGRIEQQLRHFELVMERGTAREIREAYVSFSIFLSFVEQNKIDFDGADDFDESFWTEDESK